MPKVSFILPVYRKEQELPRVIDSLKRQTMPDFEAIFVDDGSPDNSGAICAAAAREDARFRVVTQPNGGVSKARNTALDLATGEYLFFLDPDDWVEPDAAAVLTELADREQADIVVGGRFHDYHDASGALVKTTQSLPSLDGVFRGEPFKEHFDKLATAYFITGKLLRRAFVEQHHIRFPAMNIGEDGAFYIAFYSHDPACLVCTRRPLYHYTLTDAASLSSSYHANREQYNFYLSNATRAAVEAWGLSDSPMHRRMVQFCTVRDLQMTIKNIGLAPVAPGEKIAMLKKEMQSATVRGAVRDTPLSMAYSRNDKIKLLLLKAHLYGLVMRLSAHNGSHG